MCYKEPLKSGRRRHAERCGGKAPHQARAGDAGRDLLRHRDRHVLAARRIARRRVTRGRYRRSSHDLRDRGLLRNARHGARLDDRARVDLVQQLEGSPSHEVPVRLVRAADLQPTGLRVHLGLALFAASHRAAHLRGCVLGTRRRPVLDHPRLPRVVARGKGTLMVRVLSSLIFLDLAGLFAVTYPWSLAAGVVYAALNFFSGGK